MCVRCVCVCVCVCLCVCEVDNVDQDGNPIGNSEDSSRGLMGGRLHDVCVCLGVCVLGVCVCVYCM